MKKRRLAGLLAVVMAAGSITIYGGNEKVFAADKNDAPVLSGTNYIQVKKGEVFDKNDALSRVFAMDKEDGDLTQLIQVKENTVDTKNTGSYQVTYEVTDSKNLSDSLTTVVEVVDNFAEEGQKIQRTLYTKEPASYLISARTERGYNHDRQHLGIYLNSGATLNIRIVNAEEFKQSLQLDLLTDDMSWGAEAGTSQWLEIPGDGSFLTVNAGEILDEEGKPTGRYLNNYRKEGDKFVETDIPADSVAFIRTPQSDVEPVIEYYINTEQGMEKLTYYHYGDNETAFLNSWNQNTQDYAVIDGERETILVPRRDKDILFSASNNDAYNFDSLDEMLEFYDEMQNQYDRYLGVSYHADNPVDENIRAKFFVAADLHGVGAAYYAGNNFTAQNGNSINGFFQKDWMFLHEFAHGYEGSLANGDLALVEIFNNILAHYYERTYLTEGDDGWSGLQDLSKAEGNYVADRENHIPFNGRGFDARLYVFVNLLNKIGAEEGMSSLHHAWRQTGGNTTSTTDFIVEHFCNYSGYNLIPYFKKCGVVVSEAVETRIYEKHYPVLNYLGDYYENSVNAGEASKLLNTDGIYALVDNKELADTGDKGNVTLEVELSDKEELKGNTISLMDGEKVVASQVIEGNRVKFTDIPIGTYTLVAPTVENLLYYLEPQVVEVKANQTAKEKIVYKKAEDKLWLYDAQVSMYGLGDTKFLDMFYDSEKGCIILDIKGGQPHSYFGNEPYISLEITDPNQSVLFTEEYIGDTNYPGILKAIDVEAGSVIRIRHIEVENRLKITSRRFSGQEYQGLTEEDKSTSPYMEFVITENGLSRTVWKEGQFQEVQMEIFLDYLKSLDQQMTEEQKKNPAAYQREKAQLRAFIQTLSVEKQEELKKEYSYLYPSQEPSVTLEKITVKAPTKTEYEIGEKLDLTGMVVTAHYSNNTTRTVEVSEKDVTGFDSRVEGEKTITVTYEGKTASFKVMVKEKEEQKPSVTLEKITVKAPTKTEYEIGEKLDLTGMVVTAHYSNNTTRTVEVSEKDVTGFDSRVEGEKTITVTYEGKTASFKVMVKEKEEQEPSVTLEKITVKAPTKTEYEIGEKLDLTGMVVTAHYSNNTTRTVEVSEKDVTGFDSRVEGEKTITVTYEGKTASFKVTVKENNIESPSIEEVFKDVRKGDWYYDVVADVYEKNLMTGMSKTIFAPEDTLVRAQFAMILYRMAGSPKVEDKEIVFPDVKKEDWFADAVIWANSEKIITGYENTGMFGPTDKITREQMAVMMYRYAKSNGSDVDIDMQYVSQFADGGKVQEFAQTGMNWCIKNKLITGDGTTGLLLPQGDSNRAACAAVISRFSNMQK